MMHKNKKSKNLDVTAEHAATGQLVQALLMNEGYNQIFSYLFTQKNCEKRDITRWTNLHLATVSPNFENIAVENIRNKLAGTSYSSSMRLAPNSSPTKIGESIGSYAGKTFSMTSRYDEAVTSWSETNTSSPSQGWKITFNSHAVEINLILNDETLLVQNELVFRLFVNSVNHLNFSEKHKWKLS